MRVLITGANGLLGSNLARTLLHEKYEVGAIVREGSNTLSLKDIEPEIFRGSITSQSQSLKKWNFCLKNAVEKTFLKK